MKCVFALISATVLLACMLGSAEGAATINVQPTNTTSRIGDKASFYCGITGTQDPGQYHTYRKFSPSASLVASDANPSNATKYNITGTYWLTINDVLISDEGGYQCDLFPNTYSMYLTVIDPPTETTITWGAAALTTPVDVTANLTCNVPRSRPPAALRWTKGTTDMTAQATLTTGTTDSDGYGSATSVLQITPTTADLGAVFTCFVDLADAQNVTQATLAVAFSGASSLHFSLIAAATVLLAAVSQLL